LLLSGLTLAGLHPQPAEAGWATTTSDLNLRWGPGTDYDVILVMPAGAGVNIVENLQNGFYRVHYEGVSGWASAEFLDRSGGGAPSPGGSGTATVSSALNLRAGPSTSDQVLDVMPGGATVTLAGVNHNGFASVVYNGVWGWAAAEFLDGGSSAPGGTGSAVTTSDLNLRAGPSTGDAVLAVMPPGASVTLTGDSSNGFLSIAYDGMDGWASAEYLSTDGAPAPSPGGEGTAATTTSSLNLRSGPSTGDSILTVMPAGASITVTGDPQGGFYPVTYSGTSGWAAGEFVSFGGASDPEPVGGGIVFPFTGGTWTVIQGYNGGTHQNRSAFAQYYYAIDWARADGNTAGQPIYAPASGTVGFNDPGSGGLAIVMDNGYTVAMFHVTYDAGGLGFGERVTQGQYLGFISGPGGNGYASTPHVDMTLWAGDGQSHSAAPFTGANAIAGVSFADIGGWNQHGGVTVTP
jgi:uncharacterized protein YraI